MRYKLKEQLAASVLALSGDQILNNTSDNTSPLSSLLHDNTSSARHRVAYQGCQFDHLPGLAIFNNLE